MSKVNFNDIRNSEQTNKETNKQTNELNERLKMKICQKINAPFEEITHKKSNKNEYRKSSSQQITLKQESPLLTEDEFRLSKSSQNERICNDFKDDRQKGQIEKLLFEQQNYILWPWRPPTNTRIIL